MQFSDLKYLSSYIFPVIAIFSLSISGPWSFITLIAAFGVVPIIEQLMNKSTSNLSNKEADRKTSVLFDALLYLNVPIVYGIIGLFLYRISHNSFSNFELVGMTLTLGFVLGSSGINVAHELGHRANRLSKYCTRLLLLPSLYMHFTLEHNYGHHVWVATPHDPATARKNEWLFTFWIRSTVLSYLNAWKIEKRRLGGTLLRIDNQLIWMTAAQILWLTCIYFFFGKLATGLMLGAAVFSFLLLETINYIEHYGLERTQLDSGRYEVAKPHHSWNSNHQMGRIMLYELTRHSDHHYKTDKKYQLLNHHDISPQLPMGYPAAMLLAAIPPLWFTLINPRLQALSSNTKSID